MSVERPYGWVVVAASLVLVATGAGGIYFVVVALKPIAAEFGWPRGIPSLGYSLAMVGMGAGGIYFGPLSDRVGVAFPALIGALMVAAGAFLVGASTGPWQFLAAHLVFIGLLGNAALFSPLVANVTRWFDRNRGVAVAIVTNGYLLAGAGWPPIFGYLIDGVGWRRACAVFAGIALAIMVPMCALLRRRPPSHPGVAGSATDAKPNALVFGSRAGVMQGTLCVAIIGCCVAMAIPMVHVVAYASDLGHPPTRAVELLSVLLGSGFVSRLVWGFVSDRIGGLSTLFIGSVVQVAGLSLFLLADSLAGLYLVSALFGAGFGAILPCYAVIIREIFPVAEIGRRIGAVYFFGTVGMALGGWLAGAIFDLTGTYRVAFAVGVAFNLLNLAIVSLLRRRQRRLAFGSAAHLGGVARPGG